MGRIERSKYREIIEDFAEEIRNRRTETARPSTEVINFRDDYAEGTERKVWKVPTEVLRFRKDNGRIASDVLDHETNVGPLDEKDKDAQEVLRGFLRRKDPEKTEVLRKSIMHSGQREPAIITCDGFLINGNRRKMVVDALAQEAPEEEQYRYMKVVILPGKDDQGGPPTLFEIEKLENRYQLQSDGKSEYYGFDRALSIKRKIEVGLTLEAQIRDDPRHAGASKKDIKKAVREWTKKYLDPLDKVDRYLAQFGREGLYGTVSTGLHDKEGRWQAFVDYSNTYHRDLESDKNRAKYGIDEEEVGELEVAAFNIIRLRALPDLPKVHAVMRDFAKYCRTPEGKDAIKEVARQVEPTLEESECYADDGSTLSFSQIEDKWAGLNKETIIYNLKKAVMGDERRSKKETPLTLLEAAYKKLTNDEMDISAISIKDLRQAKTWVTRISERAGDLDSEIYHHRKKLKKLVSS